MISKSTLKKAAYWLLIIFGIVGLYFVLKGQSNHMGKRKNVYTIGRDVTWYPFDLQGKNSNLTAFTNELMTAISEEAKIKFQWIDTFPSTLVSGLDNQLYDTIISGMVPNAVTEQTYLFSDPIIRFGLILVVKADSKANSLEDLKGLTVGFRSGSSAIYNALKEGGATAYDVVLIPYDSYVKAIDALAKNQVDSVIMEPLTAYAILESFYKGKIKIISKPLTSEGLRLVSLKNEESEALLELFNESLQKLKENGSFQKMIKKWNLFDPEQLYLESLKQNTSNT